MRALLSAVFLLLALSASALAAPVPAEPALPAIIRAEDARNGTALTPYLRHADPKVRARAVRAIGRLQDPQHLGTLSERARADVPEVRLEAIFAIGQLGVAMAEEPLVSLLDAARTCDERLRIIAALGKVAAADGPGHARLVTLLTDSDAAVCASAALALEELAWRLRRAGTTPWAAPQADVEALLPLLAETRSPAVRAAAAGALWRFAWVPAGAARAPLGWADRALDALAPLCAAADADVRMRGVEAIGEVAAPDRLPSGVGRLLNDGDWRVRVEAAEAVGRAAAAGRAWPVLLQQALQDPHPLVVLASLRALESMAGRHHTLPGRDVYAVSLDARRPLQVRAEALRIAVAFQDFGGLPSPPPFGVIGPPSPRLRLPSEDWKTQWRLRRALAEGAASHLTTSLGTLTFEMFESQYQVTLRPFLTDSDARVRGGAVEACAKALAAVRQTGWKAGASVVDAKRREAVEKSLEDDLVARLSDDDTIVRAAAADAAAELRLDRAVPAIIATLEGLQAARDGEVMESLVGALGRLRDQRAVPVLERLARDPHMTLARAAAAALQSITGAPPVFEKRASAAPPVPAEAISLAEQAAAGEGGLPRAVIHTPQGDITIRLYVADAPLTVYSFTHLARAGYFNGLTFHRVVPNFVVQGGDPRGDGWGGPGYTIRCEYNPIPYSRGTVGMALAGKDTGGSQFFITHSPQPRLDGRYTVFGQVVAGMDVVDRLTEGDVMRVEIVEP